MFREQDYCCVKQSSVLEILCAAFKSSVSMDIFFIDEEALLSCVRALKAEY